MTNSDAADLSENEIFSEYTSEELEQMTSSMERGKRLYQARRMSGLSRAAIEAKYDIKAPSLKSWESGRYRGLTAQSARRISMVLKKEGIQCTIAWLLSGIGNPPSVIQKMRTTTPTDPQNSHRMDSAITREIETFCQNHPNSIVTQPSDDGMEPFYHDGDYVAGERYDQELIPSAIGYHCIIETQMGEILVRVLREGSKEGLYTLQCTNLNTQLKRQTLYDVEISSVAPILWHRRTRLR